MGGFWYSSVAKEAAYQAFVSADYVMSDDHASLAASAKSYLAARRSADADFFIRSHSAFAASLVDLARASDMPQRASLANEISLLIDQNGAYQGVRIAIQCGIITLWQCQMLIGGRKNGFAWKGYSLKDKLAGTQRSSTYLAWHIGLARYAQLTFIRRDTAQEVSDISERIGRIAGLRGPEGVTGCYSVDIGPRGELVLICEHCPGIAISEIANDWSMSERHAAFIIMKLCVALQELHSCGVVLAYLTPSSVVVTETGVIKLDCKTTLLRSDDYRDFTSRSDAEFVVTCANFASEYGCSIEASCVLQLWSLLLCTMSRTSGDDLLERVMRKRDGKAHVSVSSIRDVCDAIVRK